MNQFSFNDEDKKKVVDFLNFVAKNGKFEVNTQEIIDYFKLLSYMQGTLLPKIEANVLEITKITQAPQEDKSNKKSK
jgi:hypothetical protein